MATLAKLTRPRLHRVLPRERLFARLDECRQAPLVWLSGPPGAGKTSLAAAYLEARKLHGWWYQVDAGDADLGTFFHYLTLAAATARKRDPLPAMAPQHQGDLHGFARLYFRALFARVKAPAVLVLDNYHELPASCVLHALLDTVAREAPEGVCVLVVSRTPPPPTCAALRAQGLLSTLEWDELRLTLEETRRIAELRHIVDEDVLRAAHARSDGWPVGLVLVLEDWQRSAGAVDIAREQGREVLFDYFAGQIFSTLPEERCRILMLLALLRRASPAQAEQLTGSSEAAGVLENLYRRRLFVDRRGDTYQFHDLFRAFLLQQFERAFPGEPGRQWKSTAARLLLESEQVEDAILLAREAADWELASRIILTHAARTFEQGRSRLLLEWIDMVPEPVLERVPWLVFWAAVALAARSPAHSRERFEAAYARFEGSDDLTALTLSCGGVLATSYWEFDSLTMLDPWIDRLLALLKQNPQYPRPAAELRIHAALMSALSLRRPDPALLEGVLQRIYALLDPEVAVSARLDAAAQVLAHCCATADYPMAARIRALAAPWLHEPHLAPVYPALWWMQVANHHATLAEDDAAVAAYARALDEVQRNVLTAPLLHVHCQFGLARLALCRDDIAAAEAARAKALESWTAARRVDSCIDAGLRGLLAGRRGDRVAALALAREQFEQAGVVGLISLQYYGALQLAAACVDAGHAEDAEQALASARVLIEGTAFTALAYQADLVAAYAALATGDSALAHGLLARGLQGSRCDPGLLTLRLLPGVLPALLAHAVGEGIDADYAVRLIRRLKVAAPSEDPPAWPWPLEVRMLGRFEIRRDGEPLAYSRKTPRKTLALLKAIAALGSGGGVSEQRLLDTLWPDEEADAAAHSLAATVLRLRSLLGDAAAVIQQGGKLSVDRSRVWLDVLSFEQALVRAELARQAREAAEVQHLARAMTLYGGAFLVDDHDNWPIATRERLRGRFIHAVSRLAQSREEQGDPQAAITACLRGLDADPAVESFYQGLMRCHQALGQRSEAIAAYQRLRQILSVTLGLAPSAASERLYQSLRA